MNKKLTYAPGDFLITFEKMMFILKSIDPVTSLVYDHVAIADNNIFIDSRTPTCHVTDIDRHATIEEMSDFLLKVNMQGKLWDYTSQTLKDLK